ncbi:MAG: hypothetical protein AAF465_05075 [Pseudomonadota bacterium]
MRVIVCLYPAVAFANVSFMTFVLMPSIRRELGWYQDEGSGVVLMGFTLGLLSAVLLGAAFNPTVRSTGKNVMGAPVYLFSVGLLAVYLGLMFVVLNRVYRVGGL